MQSALQSVAGVESAEVNFDSKTATVVCKAGCDQSALVSALEAKGFGGTVK